jgi:hypothetical protein
MQARQYAAHARQKGNVLVSLFFHEICFTRILRPFSISGIDIGEGVAIARR